MHSKDNCCIKAPEAIRNLISLVYDSVGEAIKELETKNPIVFDMMFSFVLYSKTKFHMKII